MDTMTNEIECNSCSFAFSLTYDTEQMGNKLNPLDIDVIFCPNCGNEFGTEYDVEENEDKIKFKELGNDLDDEIFF